MSKEDQPALLVKVIATMQVSIALAFSAGLIATVNPCGFAMLPAYLSYFLGAKDQEVTRGLAARAAQGLLVGAIVTAGFVTVFGSVGLLIAAGLRGVIGVVPWLALGIGAGLLILGILVASGRHVGLSLPSALRPSSERGYRSVFVFGVAYATASLSCTLPAFLSVVGTSLTVGGLARLPVLFLFYAMGTAAVLFAVSISAALARGGVTGLIRRAIPWIERTAGVVLAVAGAYIVFYWTINLSDAGSDSSVRVPIRMLERLQSAIAGWLAGSGGAVAGIFVLAIAVAIWTWINWRRAGQTR